MQVETDDLKGKLADGGAAGAGSDTATHELYMKTLKEVSTAWHTESPQFFTASQ